MALTCTRKIEFDAAHRVMEHESKCRLLHGHRYVVEATFTADKLDDLGRVIDFGVIKEVLGGWVDEHWDHNAVLHQNDKELGEKISSITGQGIYYIPCNPTAENMAEYLLNHVCKKLFADMPIECIKIKLWETPNCFAEAY